MLSIHVQYRNVKSNASYLCTVIFYVILRYMYTIRTDDPHLSTVFLYAFHKRTHTKSVYLITFLLNTITKYATKIRIALYIQKQFPVLQVPVLFPPKKYFRCNFTSLQPLSPYNNQFCLLQQKLINRGSIVVHGNSAIVFPDQGTLSGLMLSILLFTAVLFDASSVYSIEACYVP